MINNVMIVTSILNAMHKEKASELLKAEVLCIMLELCRGLFQSLQTLKLHQQDWCSPNELAQPFTSLGRVFVQV